MTSDESFVLTIADIVRDSVVMNDAALASDFDEARFRAQLIVFKRFMHALAGQGTAATAPAPAAGRIPSVFAKRISRPHPQCCCPPAKLSSIATTT